MSYREFLKQKRRDRLTIDRKEREMSKYFAWLKERRIDIKQTRYSDVMDFVGYLQDIENTAHQINRILQAMSDYYDYLEMDNPAYKVRVRGIVQKAPGVMFSSDQLDQIYECYEVNHGSWGYHFHSNKVVLGMMIYQGLELNSFFGLRLQDVDFKKGRLYIRAHNRRMERYIPLEARQIMPLQEYMHKREEIIQEWLWKRRYIPESQKVITDRLFSPQCEYYCRMHEQHKSLSKDLKRQALARLGLVIKKFSQLRQSRITVWIDQVGVRKTQYFAGLKVVDSIERYKKKDLKGLKKAVKKYHPR